jgi:hypothetical protein
VSIVVVIPSRGRPERARLAVQAIRDTAALVTTEVNLVVDGDDPELEAYRALRWGPPHRAATFLMVIRDPDATGNLVKATNTASLRIAQDDPTAIIGNVGDDQIARTPGWDRAVTAALWTPGIAYGDDGFQHEALPCGGTFMSAAIVNALGWYALPTCEHLFIDNAWADLGRELGRLTYLPDVVFEHLHPFAGKSDWDEGYERANNQAVIDRDRTAYEAWRGADCRADAARVQASIG